MGGTHLSLKKRRKIWRVKWGLYFSWFCFEKSCSNVGETHWLTKDSSVEFVNSLVSTSKADFEMSFKEICVGKIFDFSALENSLDEIQGGEDA